MGREFIDDVILKRRSCRSFLADEVPEDDVKLLVESMRWAPSAGNMQPWRFYVVRDNTLKEKLVHAAFGQHFIAEAPVVFVVCAVPTESEVRYGSRGRELYSIQDTACATMNLMLAATALGYGSCWVGAFDERAVSNALNLHQSERAVAIVPVGKPKNIESPTPRKPAEKIVQYL